MSTSNKAARPPRTLAKLPRKPPAPRKPGSGNGRLFRTPAQLERQERVFNMSVMQGLSARKIAEILQLDSKTVIKDLRSEEARRSEELGDRREAEKARAVAFYEGIANRAISIALSPQMPGDSGRLSEALKARERIDKIIGIDAPVQIEAGLGAFLDALKPKE